MRRRFLAKRNSASPKLRSVEKVPAPYPLGQFPKGFAMSIGRQIIYLLATRSKPVLEGQEWERVFAEAIGAEWKPSNVGLDDIVAKNSAWGAKSLKHTNPWDAKAVRLICGRNSPLYSYDQAINGGTPPEVLGGQVLGIWNARVEAVLAKYRHVRTVVLIKSSDLLKLTIFESELVRYDPKLYTWTRNARGNLEGRRGRIHCFTWQPHGSQFTIIESVPESKLCLRLRSPERLDQGKFLDVIGFDDSWVEVVKK